jgi:hypothetical protein
MEAFHKISPASASTDPVKEIGGDWMLISAKKKDGSINTMTASWGGVGVLWGKTVAFCFIRPQRYTLEFVKEAECFSLSFFGGAQKEALTLCGRTSGKDCDKIAKAGLHPIDLEGVPAFREATKVLKVKKLYKDLIRPEGFLDPALESKNYPAKDYHVVYVAEILEVFERED